MRAGLGERGNGSVIITCERCATQFQLDDSRVPVDGVRVRCSRCKHAFQVMRPGLSEAERIHQVARRALEPSPGTPDPTQDLDGPARGPEGLEEEESDWEFNDDRPFVGDGDDTGSQGIPSSRDVVDELLGPAVPPDVAAPKGVTAQAAPAVRPAPKAVPAPAAEGGTRTLDVEDLGSDLDDDDDLELDGAAAGATAASAETPDELGDPDDWDFFADDADAGAAMDAVGPQPERQERRLNVVPTVEDDEELGAFEAWRARAGGIAGWVAALGLFAAGVVGGIAPASAPATTTRAQLGSLAIEDLETVWVDHLAKGPVWVVSGRLHNRGSSPVSGALCIELIDAAGQPLDGRSIPLGPPLRGEALRLAEVGADAAEPAPLRPGAERRFSAALAPLPANATGFRFVDTEGRRAEPQVSAAPLRRAASPPAAGARPPAAPPPPTAPAAKPTPRPNFLDPTFSGE